MPMLYAENKSHRPRLREWHNRVRPVDFYELKNLKIPAALDEWKTIRRALEAMPQEVIVEMCKMRGLSNIVLAVWKDR
jgi:hypothetical protein